MISVDTLIVTIHNVDEYTNKNFYEYIQSGLFQTTLEGVDRLHDDPVDFRIKNMRSMQRRYEESTKIFLNGKNFFRSSHYGISFSYCDTQKILRLNFSIPKLLYGTNVFMHLTDIYSFQSYQYDHHVSQKQFGLMMKVVFDVMQSFSFTPLTNENLSSAQIDRADICVNYVFNSQEDRDEYFLKLSSMKRKYRSLYAGMREINDQTIYFPSQDYMIKFYKKDAEFKKNDLSELYKVESQDYCRNVLKLAKRTLRYEVTYRNGGLSKVQRKLENDLMNEFDFQIQEADQIRKELLPLSLKFFFYGYQDELIPENFINLLSFKQIKHRNFSYALYKAICLDAKQKMNDFVFTSFPSSVEFNEKLARYAMIKKANGKKLYTGRLKHVFNQMQNEQMTLQMLAHRGDIHRNSIANIQEKFNEMGIDVSRMVQCRVSLPKDLSNYLNTLRIDFDIAKFARKSTFV